MPTRKVLIIDDDEALLPVLKTAFQRYKFEVLVTTDAADGLEKAHQAHPDLIILSVELPVGNGFLVCKDLKQDADLKDIPVIITSRKASDADFEKHRKLKVRADDYLHKPFTDEELFAKVGNVVGFSISPDEYTELEAKVHDFLEERHKLEAEISEKAERIAELEGKAMDEAERAAELELELSSLRKGSGKTEKLEARIAELENKLSQQEADFAAEAGARQNEIKKAEKARAAIEEKLAAIAIEVGVSIDELPAQVEEWREAAEALLRAEAAREAAAAERDELLERVKSSERELKEAQQNQEREVKKRSRLREVLEKAIATLD